MKKFKFLLIAIIAFSVNGFSQTPTDYLSKEFHKERRDILRSKMPANSVTVVFANPVRNRANDVDFVFHSIGLLVVFSNVTLFIFLKIKQMKKKNLIMKFYMFKSVIKELNNGTEKD